jgi:hypothetical protein
MLVDDEERREDGEEGVVDDEGRGHGQWEGRFTRRRVNRVRGGWWAVKQAGMMVSIWGLEERAGA